MPWPNCDICEKPAFMVAASPMGPISLAYCEECLDAKRENWNVLVGGLIGYEKGTEADWVKPIIEATLKFYNKTEDELWAEVKTTTEEYYSTMKGEIEG